MTDLWTPSDDLLARDPVAMAHVTDPFDTPDLEAQGVVLPDVEDHEANELLAAVVLAELDDDDVAGDEPGDVDDDDDVDGDEDEPVAAEV